MNERGIEVRRLETRAAMLTTYCLPGSTETEASIAAWNGHEFEILPCHFGYGNSVALYTARPHPQENTMEVYYPVDPRIISTDIAGATAAYPNEDNTGWLFRHCDPNCMTDHEYELRATMHGVFRSAIDAAQVKVNEASNQAVRTRVVSTHRLLGAFQDAAVEAVLTKARTRHIGWYEQYPHEAHIHLPIRRAIDATVAVWQTDRRQDYVAVSGAVAGILKAIGKLHAYETRWDQAARMEAERKAAEAASAEPEEAQDEGA